MTRWLKLTGLFAIAVAMMSTSLATADITTQYSFENNLLDTAGAGTTADNLTGTALTGPLATSYQTGIVGNAVFVSGSAGAATVLQAADSNDLDLSPSWTIEAFVKPDSANTGEWDRFITKWFDGGNAYHWAFRNANNGQDLFQNGANVIPTSTTGTVPLNEWLHVAYTGSPATGIQLWQNGVVVGSGPYAPVNDSTSPFRIGNFRADAGNAPSQFSGLVDELLIQDVAQDASYMAARAAMLPSPPPPPPPPPIVPVPVPPPSTGLVSYWTFDGTTDDVASSFAANVGSANDNLTPRGGSANYEAGIIGQALRVGVNPGDTTDLNAAVSEDVNLPSTYTIQAWVKPSELTDTWQRLVLNWGGSDFAYHFAIRNNGGFVNGVSLFHGQSNGAQVNVNGGTVVAGEWQQIAGVADGTNLNVYLNGELVAQTPYDGTIFTSASEGLGIGDSDTALSDIKFNGLLDDVAMWSVPLSPEQILFQYQNGLAGRGAPVPEPASVMLIAIAGLGLIARRRRIPQRG